MARLYPENKPYRKGYLKVSDGYEIYYELVGNPKGIPVLDLHGGPGGTANNAYRKYINPKRYNGIFFDQRGAGRSMPSASIRNNTTWKLLDDINALLDHLGIDRAILLGGSWGTTLALVYAINYPERVMGMILKSVFIGDPHIGEEGDFFPELQEKLFSLVPKKFRKSGKSVAKYYLKQMQSKNAATRKKYLWAWTSYDTPMIGLDSSKKLFHKMPKNEKSFAGAIVNAHYMGNNCFLPKNYILKNAGKIENIPTVIIHGRFDVMCRPVFAYKLHKAISKSKLYFMVASHGKDQSSRDKLADEMDKFYKIVR